MKCEKCNKSFTEKLDLEKHIKNAHKPQLNCNDCHFQASSGPELRKYLNKKNHNPVEGIDKESLGETLTCKGCGEEFSEWWNLMNHRQDALPDNRRRCKNYINGECEYSAEGPHECWWRHEAKATSHKKDSSELQEICNICDEMFKTKSEMMFHKKNENLEKVPSCKKISLGRCDYPAPECWFRHNFSQSEQTYDRQPSPSVFLKNQTNSKPPELEELREVLKQALLTMMYVKEKIHSMSC